MVYKEEKWVGLREAGLSAVEVREVGGIDSVGQHGGGEVCGHQTPVPSTRALHIMYVRNNRTSLRMLCAVCTAV